MKFSLFRRRHYLHKTDNFCSNSIKANDLRFAFYEGWGLFWAEKCLDNLEQGQNNWSMDYAGNVAKALRILWKSCWQSFAKMIQVFQLYPGQINSMNDFNRLYKIQHGCSLIIRSGQTPYQAPPSPTPAPTRKTPRPTPRPVTIPNFPRRPPRKIPDLMQKTISQQSVSEE